MKIKSYLGSVCSNVTTPRLFHHRQKTWVSFIIHPTPQCIKLKQHSYPCLLSLILGQGVVCKHCSHCQSYIQVKRCSAIIIPAAVQTDSSRKADEGSTELLTFHSPVSLVILRRFFSLINHLNYSSKISGRVMWGLTFMSLQCNTGTQALINQQAILRQILNYSDISGNIISIKFGQCISKRSCSRFEYKDIISKREVDVWRSNFKSVEWELQKVQRCIKRQFAIS